MRTRDQRHNKGKTEEKEILGKRDIRGKTKDGENNSFR
jgi:hypothetical protein